MKTRRILSVFSACVLLFCAQIAAAEQPLVEGLEAYAREDWASAILFFRKNVSAPGTATADAWYWLVMSEVAAGQFNPALADADIFIKSYANTARYPDMLYQRGLILYQLNRRDEAIRQLNDFFTAYPAHEMASAALFWIAESLYESAWYEEAGALYSRLIREYPDSGKREASSYRIALLEQQKRENELLVLLKITHENALRSAEEFERRSKNYEQAIIAYQKRIADILKDTRVSELEKELANANSKNRQLQSRIAELENRGISTGTEAASAADKDYSSEIGQLRRKLLQVEQSLESGGAQ